MSAAACARRTQSVMFNTALALRLRPAPLGESPPLPHVAGIRQHGIITVIGRFQLCGVISKVHTTIHRSRPQWRKESCLWPPAVAADPAADQKRLLLCCPVSWSATASALIVCRKSTNDQVCRKPMKYGIHSWTSYTLGNTKRKLSGRQTRIRKQWVSMQAVLDARWTVGCPDASCLL